ncbi:MAG: hypothetical protein WAO78_01635 [Roseovarius sp.]
MTTNTVIDFVKPSNFSPDPLTDLLRAGAQELLATAVRAEVSEFMKGHAHLLDDDGRQRLVRHGRVAWIRCGAVRALPETDFRRCVRTVGGRVQSSG